MSVVLQGESIADLREDLRRLPPPYLLRKYATTEADYDSITDEDLRGELLDGVLIVHSPPWIQREERVVFVTTWLNLVVQTRRLGKSSAPTRSCRLDAGGCARMYPCC